MIAPPSRTSWRDAVARRQRAARIRHIIPGLIANRPQLSLASTNFEYKAENKGCHWAPVVRHGREAEQH
jgi:hypothetical protein